MHVEKQGQRFVGVSFIGFCASIVALVDFLLGHGADRGVAGIALVICFLLWVAEPNRRPQTASTGSIGIWQLAGLIGRRNRSVEVAGLTTCEFLDAGTAFGWGKTGDGHVGVGLVRAVGRRGPTGDAMREVAGDRCTSGRHRGCLRDTVADGGANGGSDCGRRDVPLPWATLRRTPITALRGGAWLLSSDSCDGGSRPGDATCEQQVEAVVGERSESVADPAGLLYEEGDGLGRAVRRSAGVVIRQDLGFLG
jgi:hypothetical protein